MMTDYTIEKFIAGENLDSNVWVYARKSSPIVRKFRYSWYEKLIRRLGRRLNVFQLAYFSTKWPIGITTIGRPKWSKIIVKIPTTEEFSKQWPEIKRQAEGIDE